MVHDNKFDPNKVFQSSVLIQACDQLNQGADIPLYAFFSLLDNKQFHRTEKHNSITYLR